MTQPRLGSVLPDGDALIIVPPFAGLDRPSIGVHVLQGCAAERQLRVGVLYANLFLAAEIGELNYQAICYGASGALLGERFFAAAAYGIAPFGRDTAYLQYFNTSAKDTTTRSKSISRHCNVCSRLSNSGWTRSPPPSPHEATASSAARRRSSRRRPASRCSIA